MNIFFFIFCNTVNVFTATFDQSNESLISKSVHFFFLSSVCVYWAVDIDCWSIQKSKLSYLWAIPML